jgi:hypothetical protein
VLLNYNGLAGFFRIATLPITILLCALALPAPAGAAAPDSTRALDGAAAKAQPALWAQAVKIYEANKDLVPGKVLQKIEELDDDGRVKSESNVEIVLSLGGDGNIKSEIVKASKDGKDITAEERKKADEREKKQAAEKEKEAEKKKEAEKNAAKDSNEDSKERSHSISSGDSPFNPELQNDVTVTETNTRETIDGRSCVRFDYAYPVPGEKPSKKKPAMVKGTAWIEEGTGNPVKLEFTNDPLPKGAKSMLTTMRYGNGENGSWILERMEFEASGSFLFFKKRIRGDIALGDYWKYVEPSPQE